MISKCPQVYTVIKLKTSSASNAGAIPVATLTICACCQDSCPALAKCGQSGEGIVGGRAGGPSHRFGAYSICTLTGMVLREGIWVVPEIKVLFWYSVP